MNELQIHPLCLLVPPITKDEYSSIVDSMRRYGYRKEFPIITKDNWVIDGRHRLKAAAELSLTPEEHMEEYNKSINNPEPIKPEPVKAKPRRTVEQQDQQDQEEPKEKWEPTCVKEHEERLREKSGIY